MTFAAGLSDFPEALIKSKPPRERERERKREIERKRERERERDRQRQRENRRAVGSITISLPTKIFGHFARYIESFASKHQQPL